MLEWFVYILKSMNKDFIYIGSTNNLEKRLFDHNQGLVQSTKSFKPYKILAHIAVRTEQKVRTLEKYFKTGSEKAVLKKRILTDEVA